MSQAPRTSPSARGGRSRGRGRRRPRRWGPGARLAVAVVAGLLVVLGVGAALAIPSGDGDAPDRVEVDGVDVSGLGPGEVERAVRQRARELMRVPVTIVRADDPAFRVAANRASLGARPRIRAAVEEALEPRGFGGRLMSQLGLASTREVPLEFTVRPARVEALVRRVVQDVNDPAVPARLQVTEDDIELLPGKGGFGVDPMALRERISELPAEPIEVALGPLEPPVSDEAAARARERALRLVAEPVMVSFRGRGVEIEPEVLRAALRFVPEPPDLRGTLRPAVLYEDIASAFSTREQPARDAELRIEGSSVRVIPSRIGRMLDMQAIASAIVAGGGGGEVRARFTTSRPQLTTEEARGLRITELVSEFSTPYNCCEPRVTNIARAAEILDGHIIPAGSAFSLNDVLGPRTEDRGFVSAPQIAAGRLEEAIGGGVSQVATTIYNTAFFAGLDLVEHTPHQFYISRYPEGREATVSYGGPELVFVNDWSAAILIDAVAGSNAITIRFFSSNLGRRVETETGARTNFRQPRVRQTRNPDLEPGERVVEQPLGGAGFTVSYSRKVWAGDELKRDETYTWTYSPQDAFVEVGPPKKPTRPRRRPPQDETTPQAPEAPGGSTAPESPPSEAPPGSAPPLPPAP
jgi:vancomycin resistance protein YoaR